MGMFDPPDDEPPALSTILFVGTVMAVVSGVAGLFMGPKPHFSLAALLYTVALIGLVFFFARDYVMRYLGLAGYVSHVERNAVHYEGDEESFAETAESLIFWMPMLIFAGVWLGGVYLIIMHS